MEQTWEIQITAGVKASSPQEAVKYFIQNLKTEEHAGFADAESTGATHFFTFQLEPLEYRVDPNPNGEAHFG
jgi:hypothetical protein